jgi:hypothetical protein
MKNIVYGFNPFGILGAFSRKFLLCLTGPTGKVTLLVSAILVRLPGDFTAHSRMNVDLYIPD